eukprot:4222403-Alexandrium_andersonii.AAC.1
MATGVAAAARPPARAAAQHNGVPLTGCAHEAAWNTPASARAWAPERTSPRPGWEPQGAGATAT